MDLLSQMIWWSNYYNHVEFDQVFYYVKIYILIQIVFVTLIYLLILITKKIMLLSLNSKCMGNSSLILVIGSFTPFFLFIFFNYLHFRLVSSRFILGDRIFNCSSVLTFLIVTSLVWRVLASCPSHSWSFLFLFIIFNIHFFLILKIIFSSHSILSDSSYLFLLIFSFIDIFVQYCRFSLFLLL